MHFLIVGTTGTGKSTLARELARRGRLQGRHVLVLDPHGASGWGATMTTKDPDRFAEVIQQSRSCDVFVDEAYQYAGRTKEKRHPALEWLLREGRHRGHRAFLVSHRTLDVDPTARAQCRYLYSFRQSPDDAAALARQWAAPRLADELPRLAPYHFLVADSAEGVIGAGKTNA